MAAILATVGDAIVGELQDGVDAGTFSQTFTPVRSYLTADELNTNVGDVLVDVVRVSSKLIAQARDTFVRRCVFDIVVRRKYELADQDENQKIQNDAIDADIALLEEIEDYLTAPSRVRLSDYSTAAFVPPDSDSEDVGIRVAAAPEYLRENRQFVAALRVRYDVGLRWTA